MSSPSLLLKGKPNSYFYFPSSTWVYISGNMFLEIVLQQQLVSCLRQNKDKRFVLCFPTVTSHLIHSCKTCEWFMSTPFVQVDQSFHSMSQGESSFFWPPRKAHFSTHPGVFRRSCKHEAVRKTQPCLVKVWKHDPKLETRNSLSSRKPIRSKLSPFDQSNQSDKKEGVRRSGLCHSVARVMFIFAVHLIWRLHVSLFIFGFSMAVRIYVSSTYRVRVGYLYNLVPRVLRLFYLLRFPLGCVSPQIIPSCPRPLAPKNKCGEFLCSSGGLLF